MDQPGAVSAESLILPNVPNTLPDFDLPLVFGQPRHVEQICGMEDVELEWRVKDRMKTVSVALVLCLNVGVDPPDVLKVSPCARMETWIDPLTMPAQKAGEMIGDNLQKQYERWQPKARYKQSLDPTFDEVKKLCVSLRRNAKDDRVLLHYNGHGVPKPTANGEIWVFNERYTQYIPLSLYELQTWLGSPSLFVWDCNAAGLIVEQFNNFAEKRAAEQQTLGKGEGTEQNGFRAAGPTGSLGPEQTLGLPSRGSGSANVPLQMAAEAFGPRYCIQLAACAADEMLPTNAELPADLFTACLTTPIRAAVRFYLLQNRHKLNTNAISIDQVEQIQGSLSDRRTLLGELNWIFTAITDSIAWNSLNRELFSRLFRQDLLVASLFRNFLLADRVLRAYGCSPVSSPALPSTHLHPLWQAWDHALAICLSNASRYLQSLSPLNLTVSHVGAVVPVSDFECNPQANAPVVGTVGVAPSSVVAPPNASGRAPLTVATAASTGPNVPQPTLYSAQFFADQLTAFQVRLQTYTATSDLLRGLRENALPEQLPIVLQVLLSHVHRLRALELLCKFLDCGVWAVSRALSVGIFPYVLKLLQSAARELKPLLVIIWAKILAVDVTCQADLVKDGGHKYFLNVLADSSMHCECRTCAAFVLARLCQGYSAGQDACLQGNIISVCLELLEDPRSGADTRLRLWLVLCLAQLWRRHPAAKWCGVRNCAHEKLLGHLHDPHPEMRAAIVHALGTFIGRANNAISPLSASSAQSAANAASASLSQSISVSISISGPAATTSHSSIVDRDHSANVDHFVALHIQNAAFDSSTLVRRELCAAYVQFAIDYESQVCAVAADTDEADLTLVNEPTSSSSSSSVATSNGRSNLLSSKRTTSGLNARSQLFSVSSTPQIAQHASASALASSDESADENQPDGGKSSVRRLDKSSNANANSTLTVTSTPLARRNVQLTASNTTANFADLNSTPTLLTTSASSSLLSSGRSNVGRTSTTKFTSSGNVYMVIWRTLLTFCNDPHAEVSSLARSLVDAVRRTNAARPPRTNVAPPQHTAKYTTNRRLMHDPHAPPEPPVASDGQATGFPSSATVSSSLVASSNGSSNASRADDSSVSSHRGAFKSNVDLNSTSNTALGTAGTGSTPPHVSVFGQLGTTVHTEFYAWCCAHFLKPCAVLRTTSLSASGNHLVHAGPTVSVTIRNQLRHVPAGDECTTDATEQLRRYAQNEALRQVARESCASLRSAVQALTVEQTNTAARSTLFGELTVFQAMHAGAPTLPSILRFHPYSSRLLVVADADNINVCDTQPLDTAGGAGRDRVLLSWNNFDLQSNLKTLDTSRMSMASISPPLSSSASGRKQARITALELLNAHDERTLVLSGADDGAVRVFGFDPSLVDADGVCTRFDGTTPQVRVVTSFWAFADATHGAPPRAPLLVDFDDARNAPCNPALYLASQNQIRVWDIEKEASVLDIPSASASAASITALAHDSVSHNVLLAAFADGSVRLFDRRAPSGRFSDATRRGEHHAYVVRAHFRSQESRHFYTVAVDGCCKVWDMRVSDSVRTLRLLPPANDPASLSGVNVSISCADIQDEAQLLFGGSPDQFVAICTVPEGRAISGVRHREASAQQRIGPVLSLAVHPVLPRFAVGTTDGFVSLYNYPAPASLARR